MHKQKGSVGESIVYVLIFFVFGCVLFFNMTFRDSVYKEKALVAAKNGNFTDASVVKTNYWLGAYFTGCTGDTVAVHMNAKNLTGKDAKIIACMGQFFGEPTIRSKE